MRIKNNTGQHYRFAKHVILLRSWDLDANENFVVNELLPSTIAKQLSFVKSCLVSEIISLLQPVFCLVGIVLLKSLRENCFSVRGIGKKIDVLSFGRIDRCKN